MILADTASSAANLPVNGAEIAHAPGNLKSVGFTQSCYSAARRHDYSATN